MMAADRVDAADEKCRHGYLMSDLCAACLRPRTTPPPAPEGVDAADVLAGLQDDIFCECGVQHIVTMKPEAVLAALREAAGGGWVCIAPDGTLFTDRHTDVVQWTPDVLAMLRPVEAP